MNVVLPIQNAVKFAFFNACISNSTWTLTAYEDNEIDICDHTE